MGPFVPSWFAKRCVSSILVGMSTNEFALASGRRLPGLVTKSPTLPIQVVWMLAWREWVRFFRQPFRVVAALGQPILFWILFGTGMHSSFRGEAQTGDFMTYFLPGTTAMILLFTAIFATI